MNTFESDTELSQQFIYNLNIESSLDANQAIRRIESEIKDIQLQRERNNHKVQLDTFSKEKNNEWYTRALTAIRVKQRQIRWLKTWKLELEKPVFPTKSRNKPKHSAAYYDLTLSEQRSEPLSFETILDAEHFIFLTQEEIADMGRQIELNRLRLQTGKMDKDEYMVWYGKVLEAKLMKKRLLQQAIEWKFDYYRECYVEANPVVERLMTLDNACKKFTSFVLSLPPETPIPSSILETLNEIQELNRQQAWLAD